MKREADNLGFIAIILGWITTLIMILLGKRPSD